MHFISTHPTGVVSRTLFLEDSKRATNPQKTGANAGRDKNTCRYYNPEARKVKIYNPIWIVPKFGDNFPSLNCTSTVVAQ